MKVSKLSILLIKFVFIVISFGFIGYKLYKYDRLPVVLSEIFAFDFYDFVVLLAVFLLMFANWLTESLKWRYIVSHYEPVSVKTSLRAVFSGIAVSMFTPNRTGEFGGRILSLKKSNRLAGAFSFVIGSSSQLLITVVFGGISIVVLLLFFNNKLLIDDFFRYISIILVSLISILFLIFYFNIKIVSGVYKIKCLRKYRKQFEVFSDFSRKQLLVILLYSIIRYAIFIIQFYFLFYVFDANLSFYSSFLIITATYYIMAVIPSITLAEIGIRGSAIVFFTEIFTPVFAGTLSASIILWIINIAIPAVTGSVILSKIKINE